MWYLPVCRKLSKKTEQSHVCVWHKPCLSFYLFSVVLCTVLNVSSNELQSVLLEDHVRELRRVIRPGAKRLNWNSLGIKDYCHKCEQVGLLYNSYCFVCLVPKCKPLLFSAWQGGRGGIHHLQQIAVAFLYGVVTKWQSIGCNFSVIRCCYFQYFLNG